MFSKPRAERMVLSYSGEAVKDGTFEAKDLMNGLDGFVSLAGIIHPYIEADENLKKHTPSIRIVDVRKGSFEVVLEWIEAHPTFIASATTIIVALIGGISYYLREGKTHDPDSTQEFRLLVEKITNERKVGCKTAVHKLTLPLIDDGVTSVSIGIGKKSKTEIANKNNFMTFHDGKDIASMRVHRSISMKGQIKSLNKTTLVGEFEDDEQNIYPIKLIMLNPEQEFAKFPLDLVCIEGVATYEVGHDRFERLRRIEVESIDSAA